MGRLRTQAWGVTDNPRLQTVVEVRYKGSIDSAAYGAAPAASSAGVAHVVGYAIKKALDGAECQGCRRDVFAITVHNAVTKEVGLYSEEPAVISELTNHRTASRSKTGTLRTSSSRSNRHPLRTPSTDTAMASDESQYFKSLNRGGLTAPSPIAVGEHCNLAFGLLTATVDTGDAACKPSALMSMFVTYGRTASVSLCRHS